MIIVNLKDNDPDPPEGKHWILVEQGDDGLFYGTGFGNRDGKEVIYISNSGNDISLDFAINAAREWAQRSEINTIYVRLRTSVS